MPWSQITTADIEASLNWPELQKYRDIRDQEHADPLPILIEHVANLIRGACAAQLDLSRINAPAPLIPPSLVNSAIDIIIHRLCKRVATETQQQRKQPADDAIALLKLVALGQYPIETPDGRPATSTPAISPKTLTHQRPHQDGL